MICALAGASITFEMDKDRPPPGPRSHPRPRNRFLARIENKEPSRTRTKGVEAMP